MTMEAWALGSHRHPLRLALLLLATVPTLVLLHKYGGFRESVGLRDRIADAFVFLLVAAIASSAILFISGIVDADMRYLDATLGDFDAAASLISDGDGVRKRDRPRRLLKRQAAAVSNRFGFEGIGTVELIRVSVSSGRYIMRSVGPEREHLATTRARRL
ncbi:hypothetical protein SM0020_10900 [Sinorhizobium meliloti CCNWSX0020]|uniref:Transmembrane protein n=1 Tax=Sinorhizobium meliloti CCNWSX0020 TaxID=1107881 RepID=H0FYA4_RHIML|nr:hypothetical protein SM0020_10900 [Sinorhizobium meliloti CCNWSX0020]